TVFMNGKFCKDPKLATVDDFFFSGLNVPGNTSNPVGSNVTLVNVDKLAGLNTLGISIARLDFALYGLNPPHTHPRDNELLTVLEGTLFLDFVTSNPENHLITKVLNPCDVFVFLVGLSHFQFNVGDTNAVAIAGLSSQNPGVITIANAAFGSKSSFSIDVLTKAFQVDKNVINYLQAQFWMDNPGGHYPTFVRMFYANLGNDENGYFSRVLRIDVRFDAQYISDVLDIGSGDFECPEVGNIWTPSRAAATHVEAPQEPPEPPQPSNVDLMAAISGLFDMFIQFRGSVQSNMVLEAAAKEFLVASLCQIILLTIRIGMTDSCGCGPWSLEETMTRAGDRSHFTGS
ncbi:putative germin-like protein 2-1, partial [Malania oleifera]|uniref:putative germin-like protein 2-1 n=1 Tax=Malania oleifera TaxID=397392 RepID=UPI0025AE46A9